MGGRSSTSGWGGPRDGAGRKQRQPKVPTVLAPVVPPVASGSGVVRPEMPADAVTVWNRLAPDAEAAGTLTPATAYAFGQLCQLAVRQQKAGVEADVQGLTDVGMRVLKVYLAATALLDARMRAFRIAPKGEPLVAAQQAKPKSALERLKEQGRSLRVV